MLDEAQRYTVQLRQAGLVHPEVVERTLIRDGHLIPWMILGRQGVIQTLNEALVELLGRSPERLILRPFSEHLVPDDVRRFFKFMNDAMVAGQLRGDFVLNARDGPVPIQLMVVKETATNGERQMFRAAVIDLRSDAPSLPWLRDRPEARDLVDTIDGIAWKAEHPMRFTFVSRQAERILGFKPEQWLAEPGFWESNIHYDDRERVIRAREMAARTNQAHVLEYRMMSARRQIVWLRDSATVMRSVRGEIKLSGIISDITELKHAQESLSVAKQQAEFAVKERTAKLEATVQAMELFCYGIAHDLKAPLRALSAYSELLSEQYGKSLDAEGRDYIMRISRAARHFGSLVEALLRYGRLNHEPIEPEAIDLQSACKQAVERLGDEIKAHKARISIHCSPAAVWADPTLLLEVFINLISNALKFRKPKAIPEITVEARLGEPSNSGHGYVPVRVSVTDNGAGISDEDIGKLFQVFQRLRPHSEVPGAGIGLAMVKRATELMNGHVGVYSQPGHGSTFWFELPSAPQKRQRAERKRR